MFGPGLSKHFLLLLLKNHWSSVEDFSKWKIVVWNSNLIFRGHSTWENFLFEKSSLDFEFCMEAAEKSSKDLWLSTEAERIFYCWRIKSSFKLIWIESTSPCIQFTVWLLIEMALYTAHWCDSNLFCQNWFWPSSKRLVFLTIALEKIFGLENIRKEAKWIIMRKYSPIFVWSELNNKKSKSSKEREKNFAWFMPLRKVQEMWTHKQLVCVIAKGSEVQLW